MNEKIANELQRREMLTFLCIMIDEYPRVRPLTKILQMNLNLAERKNMKKVLNLKKKGFCTKTKRQSTFPVLLQYSPDLDPCDLYLFPKEKSALKETLVQPMEEVKAKMAKLLKRVTALL